MHTTMKEIRLADVKPNPYRDIENYRLDPVKIDGLKASINSTGFWPTVLVREVDGEYQLLFGHHRVAAAKEVLGDDYIHNFIVRENVPDHVAIRMLADENADSWSMGPQHALLCVKQAKAYLDDILTMGWDGAVSRIGETELGAWFGNRQGFGKAASEGAGEPAIRAFLGGAFSKGHGVRDALAILNSPLVDPKIAGQFTNLSQAKAFAQAVASKDGIEAGLTRPAAQKEFADDLIKKLRPQANSVDPKRANGDNHVPLTERLTAKAIRLRVEAQARARNKEFEHIEPDVLAKLATVYSEAEKRVSHMTNALKMLREEINSLPNGVDPKSLPEAVDFMRSMHSLKSAIAETMGLFADAPMNKKDYTDA